MSRKTNSDLPASSMTNTWATWVALGVQKLIRTLVAATKNPKAESKKNWSILWASVARLTFRSRTEKLVNLKGDKEDRFQTVQKV